MCVLVCERENDYSPLLLLIDKEKATGNSYSGKEKTLRDSTRGIIFMQQAAQL